MWWAGLLNVIAGSLSEGTVPSTNSYESIATVTVGAGGQSSITFSSIPSTYKHLQIRGLGRVTGSTTDSNLSLTFNSDTSSNYSHHYIFGNGGGAAAGGGSSSSFEIAMRVPGANSTSGVFGVGVIDILDYADTNKYKTARSLNGHDQNDVATGYVFFTSGSWRNTAAVTSIVLTPQSGNIAQYSSFALYGIKG